MKNETQKLDRFKQVIFDEAQLKADEIISAAEEEKNQRLAAARHDADAYVQEKITQIDKDCDAGEVRELSSEGLSSKRNILLSRQSVIDRVFANVAQKLEEFMKTPDYAEMMVSRVKRCHDAYPNQRGTVYIAVKDEGLAPMLSLNGKFDVKAVEGIEIGGLTVAFEQSGVALDCTFDSAVAQQREGFAVRAGLSL